VIKGKGIIAAVSNRFYHSTHTAGLSPTIQSIDLPMSEHNFLMDSTPTVVWKGTAGQTLEVGKLNTTLALCRSIVFPDYSSLPDGASLITAELRITPVTDYSSNARTLSVYKVLRSVASSQLCWNNYSTGNAWATGGCGNSASDYDGANSIGSGVIPASPTLNVAIAISLNPSLVQPFAAGGLPNGWLLKIDTETADCIEYHGMQDATPAYRPILRVTYY
jgi:hypothetical protein